MNSTDPIADMIIQIKNASMVGKPSVTVPFSNIKMEIAKVLWKTGYLSSVVKKGKKVKKVLVCDVAYDVSGKAKLNDVLRVSKPSRRVYGGVKDLRPVKQGFGICVLSTPKGILTDKEAKEQGVGGEILFKAW